MIEWEQCYPHSPREYLRESLREYAPPYALVARWKGDTERWATELRAKLIELLGGFPKRQERPGPSLPYPDGQRVWRYGQREAGPLDIRRLHTEQFYGYAAEKITYNSEVGIAIPAFLCVPNGLDEPIPAVVCLPDRGPGKSDLVNHQADEARQPHVAYARELAKRGYVTIAPDLRCFGECREDEAEMGAFSLLFGRPLMGQWVWDAIRAIDVLETRAEVLKDRIGCTGIGLGGFVTLYTAAVDERIAAACACGCLTTYQGALLAYDGALPGVTPEQAFEHVPGLLGYADIPDVACLVSPRPLRLMQGTGDPTYVQVAAERCEKLVREGFELRGEKIKAEVELYDGGRVYPGELAYQFLDDWLKLGLDKG